jgi:hypothetical protein
VNGFWAGSALQWITQVMILQKPQTAEAFKAAFVKLASRVRTWRQSVQKNNPAWLWTMQQLETLFADYYAPPPAS